MGKTEVLDLEKKARQECFSEDELAWRMKEEAEPFLQELCKSGRFFVTDERTGQQAGLYYELYLLEEAVGTIVISHGFTESCLKYHELIYYFLQQGYHVAVMDHRGHGRSQREVEDITIVHIKLFSRYVKDLHAFVHRIVLPQAGNLPLYLYAHSMGGCIGAFYLEQYPKDFKKAVLNAPMLGLKLGACPAWMARILCDMKVFAGKGEHRLFTQEAFDPEEPFEGSSASSEARFNYYRTLRRDNTDVQTSSGSYYWGKEAINAGHFVTSPAQTKKVRTPVLLFSAGQDHLVKSGPQKKFAAGISDGRFVKVAGVRHEIYRAQNQVLEPYLEEIFQFLEEPAEPV